MAFGYNCNNYFIFIEKYNYTFRNKKFGYFKMKVNRKLPIVKDINFSTVKKLRKVKNAELYKILI